MDDLLNAQDQLKHMKHKLHAAKEALQQLDTDRNLKLQTLLSLIHHLSIACKGQNIELDNRLAKLRNQLTNYDKFEFIATDMEHLQQMLKGQYHQMLQQLESGRENINMMSRELLQIEQVKEASRREITYFRQTNSKPYSHVWEYIPQLEKLLATYQGLLRQHLVSQDSFSLLPQHKLLADELLELIKKIEFPAEKQQKIDKIIAQLRDNIDTEHLLNAYQQLLTLLVNSIYQEKSASQEFLFALNETLNSVRDAVGDGMTQYQRSSQLKTQLNSELFSRIDSLSQSSAKSMPLEELKQLVSEQLSCIHHTLTRKDALEQREQLVMQKTMESMQRELDSLNQEAMSYKERFFEQQKLNMIDTLTQLPNRAALEQKMDIEYRQAIRHQHPLWLAVLDIDHFKQINDTYGHLSGDKALQVIASALRQTLRESEFVARYGGEEFVLLIPGVCQDDMKQLLNRVREKIKHIPFKFKMQPVTITVSIGAAQLSGSESINDTFERADAALYQAKHQSRDRVIID
ncbi:GGDEF domain-containing protein [Shewanella sp. NIFS-20-20]|uniref:GGDEF domain-containing protein n=1 Tax=Shewanella sp. NIFS-20-20 TaxID=2853806 RepID=UPI001C467DE1|nr:GGDEF domain-containing protein [Shewanella sp. NIFS-20-20]MBV7315357.1 diguanylate cyclase [Shewanella sp. NIFS-20-20]